MKANRHFKMRTQLSMAFALFALLLFATASFTTRWLFERQFAEYTVNQQLKTAEKLIATTVHSAYSNGQWSVAQLASIGMMALEEGMVYRLYDAQGHLLWDARTHNNGFCVDMLDNMASNMAKYKASFEGKYQEQRYPVYENQIPIGELVLGFYGPYYYQDDALVFVKTVKALLMYSGLIGLVLAVVLGVCVASRLSKPIKKLSERAAHIANGRYDVSESIYTTTEEIEGLYQNIESIAHVLAAQDALRKRLATDRAHEFRTPLMALRSQLELMIEGIWLPDAQKLTSCLEEVAHIEKLSADMEKLAQLDGVCLRHAVETFNFDVMIQETIKRFDPLVHTQGLQMHYEGHAGHFTGDRSCLSEAVVNVISNAVKYTPTGGHIHINARSRDNEVCLTITDTGCGIPSSDLPYVFERFYRADVSRNGFIKGSGIGLSIVRQVIEAHGGNVSIQSTHKKGTTVIIHLPQKS